MAQSSGGGDWRRPRLTVQRRGSWRNAALPMRTFGDPKVWTPVAVIRALLGIRRSSALNAEIKKALYRAAGTDRA
jgi:hypothetical protein